MKEEVVFRTEDHPEANGRKAQVGETAYAVRFPLEDGRELVVHFGKRGFDTLGQMVIDSLADTPSYSDGSTNQG